MRTLASSIVLGALLGSLAGCATVTGKSAGESIDDALTTAAVKTRLAQEKLSSLARIDVDTHQGIVSLNGVVETEAVRARAGEAARHVGGVRGVQNNLRVQATGLPPGSTPPVTADSAAADGNRWRTASATLDGTLSEIRARARQEAASLNRGVAYESIDGFQRVEALPLGVAGARGCHQVQERVYQAGRLAHDQTAEVCR